MAFFINLDQRSIKVIENDTNSIDHIRLPVSLYHCSIVLYCTILRYVTLRNNVTLKSNPGQEVTGAANLCTICTSMNVTDPELFLLLIVRSIFIEYNAGKSYGSPLRSFKIPLGSRV